mgnify:CR=1 FL=1
MYIHAAIIKKGLDLYTHKMACNPVRRAIAQPNVYREFMQFPSTFKNLFLFSMNRLGWILTPTAHPTYLELAVQMFQTQLHHFTFGASQGFDFGNRDVDVFLNRRVRHDHDFSG